MSAAEELAGKPGGEGVMAHWQKIEKVNPGEISKIATQLTEAAEGAGSNGKAVHSAVSGLDGAWDGQSADAFVGYMQKFTTAGDDMQNAIGKAAGALKQVSETLNSAKQSVNRICSDALQEIKTKEEQIRAQHKGSDTSPEELKQEIDNAIRPIAKQAVTDVGNALQNADESLSGAKGELEGAKEPGSKFSTIPAPGEQGFTPPAKGKIGGWQPVPPPPPGETTPAGTEGHGPAPSSGPSGSPSGSGAPSGVSTGSSGGYEGASSGSSGGSSGGAVSGGLGPSGGPPTSGPPPGNVEQWIKEAIKILRENGIPVTEENIDEIWTIIEKESGGDPHAINNWDSNAAKGTPSKGLMQCIDPTFEAHKLPGHDDIYNPVDNIIAGVRYTFDRYGGFEGHPGLESMAGGGGYQGY